MKRFLSLPPNLQAPLNGLERRIAVASFAAIVVAAGAGYLTAPVG